MSEGPVKPQSHRIPLCYILSKCWLGELVTKAGRIIRFHAMASKRKGEPFPGMWITPECHKAVCGPWGGVHEQPACQWGYGHS